MIEILSITKVAYHHISLNKSFHSDLARWRMFVDTWNGISFLKLTREIVPSVNVFTDASGS